jgi:hypothetical protein
MNNSPEAIGERLRTQDNRITVDPMFCVQGRRRIYGMDPDYADHVVWVDTEEGCRECEAPKDEEETQFIKKAGYKDIWETLMVAFTEDGCKEHLELNGHNYRHYEEVRIYVESFRRCPEMIAIRAMLMNMPVPEKKGTP